MFSSHLLRCLPALLLVHVALAADAPNEPAGSRPFVERLRPDDYYAVEKLFPEKFSETNELVVLRTTAASPSSVLAIRNASPGSNYTLTIQMASEGTPGGWLKIDETLDAALGRQVLRAFALKLHRQVVLSKFKRNISKTGTDLWLYQRLPDGHIAAGLITLEDTLDNRAAVVFIDDFLRSLERLIGTEGEERSALLQKIDRTATEIILAEGG